MLYIIGIGLNPQGITKEGMLALDSCNKVFLEGYTVDFPYDIEDLHLGKKKIEILGRKEVESNFLIKEAKSKKVALLVYGSPLFATTHMTLVRDAQEQGTRVKVIYSASIFDALAGTGLQLYKFGKITSMPAWKENYNPDSFMDVVKDNKSIKAHSLILSDIGLGFKRAINQFEKAVKNKKIKLDKIIVCSQMGTEDSKVYYDNIENLKNQKIRMPFCIIIPEDLHFMEKEVLEEASK